MLTQLLELCVCAGLPLALDARRFAVGVIFDCSGFGIEVLFLGFGFQVHWVLSGGFLARGCYYIKDVTSTGAIHKGFERGSVFRGFDVVI